MTARLAVRARRPAYTRHDPRRLSSRCADIGLTTNSSCALVSSRPSATVRSPNTASISSSVARIRCGASYSTSGRGSGARRPSHSRRAPARAGGNPTNRNSSPPMPDAESAASAALGPGTGSTRSPAACAAATSTRARVRDDRRPRIRHERNGFAAAEALDEPGRSAVFVVLRAGSSSASRSSSVEGAGTSGGCPQPRSRTLRAGSAARAA